MIGETSSRKWGARAYVLVSLASWGWNAPLVAVASDFDTQVIYVSVSATGARDGTSWSDAYIDLQDALDFAAAHPEDDFEIWVAGGVYKPDRGTGDRHATFRLVNGVSVYGGFAGWEECVDERQLGSFPSILSGDLNDNDDPNAVPLSNCCEERGDPGCDNAECEQLVTSIFPQCVSTYWGYGCFYLATQLCPHLCRPTRDDNTHSLILAEHLSTPTELNGLIVSSGDGNCGGSCDMGSGSGGMWVADSNLLIKNCTFSDNAGWNGIVEIHSGDVQVENCAFADNAEPSRPMAAIFVWADNFNVRDCLFEGNYGSGVLLIGNYGRVERCLFKNNRWTALQLNGQAATVRDCVFEANDAPIYPAIDNLYYISQVINCKFLGNRGGYGGAVGAGGSLLFLNCLFSGNSSNSGVGAISIESHATLVNCTIYGNSGGSYGGVYSGESLYLIDSIIWGNSADGNSSAWAQLYYQEPSSVYYNDIQNWASGGFQNVNVEPQFVDPDGADDVLGTIDDDFRLLPTSPLINGGSPAPPLVPYSDLDGHARVLCDRVDMGAYEFGIGDFNCDRIFELADFASWPTCLTGPSIGPYSADCEAYDFHAEVDDRIDLLDFAMLQNAFGSE